MRWYNLQDLLPPVYSGIKSMFATAESENTELLSAKSNVDSILSNFFVQTCDIETLEYWENIIGIKLYGDETEDERRSMVLLYLANNWQITKPFVENVMQNLFGDGHYYFEYSTNNNLQVYIGMNDVSTNAIKRFTDWFTTVCPAHVKWTTSHVENTQSTNYISAGTTCHNVQKSTCTMRLGTDTIYLGSQSYNVNWMEFS